MKDLLDDEVFTCQCCKKQFDHTQGSWPMYTWDGEMVVEKDNECDWPPLKFVCYDCID